MNIMQKLRGARLQPEPRANPAPDKRAREIIERRFIEIERRVARLEEQQAVISHGR